MKTREIKDLPVHYEPDIYISWKLMCEHTGATILALTYELSNITRKANGCEVQGHHQSLFADITHNIDTCQHFHDLYCTAIQAL